MSPDAPSEVLHLPFGPSADGLEAQWTNLTASIPHSSYFQTPDWVLSWWETVAARPPTRVAIWRGDDGTLEAIAVASRVRQRLSRRLPIRYPLWVNGGSGPGAADHCGWPAQSSRSKDVGAWVGSLRGTIILSNLDPEDQLQSGLTGFHQHEETRCPRIDVPTDEGQVGRSNHFRRHLRNARRRLIEDGVSFKHVPPEEMTDEVLEQVMRLHQVRKAQTGWATTFTTGRAEFHRRLVSRAGPGRGPAAVLAIHEGGPVGALYGFWWQETFSYYQGGWDDRWSQLSLGTVLNAEAIAECSRRGGRIYDFLRGEEEYKERFGAVPRIDQTWIRPTGLSGFLTIARSRAAKRTTA